MLTENFGATILNRLLIDKSKVLFVPCNHDVDWRLLKTVDSESNLKINQKHRYDSLKCSFKDSKISELTEYPFITSWEFDDLFVIGFNSSWHDEPSLHVHNGDITNDSIKKIGEIISSNDLSKKVKLFITHHHMIQFSNAISHIPDYSIMNNAGNLLDLLASKGFDMIIHGHKHEPHITINQVEGAHPLVFLCAGSFSAILDQKLEGVVQNSFHVVNFQDRDKETDYILGTVRNFFYNHIHKWRKCEESCNDCKIPNVYPFGVYLNKKAMKERLKTFINEEIQKNTMIFWDDLCSKWENLYYIPYGLKTQIINEITNELEISKIDKTEKGVMFYEKK